MGQGVVRHQHEPLGVECQFGHRCIAYAKVQFHRGLGCGPQQMAYGGGEQAWAIVVPEGFPVSAASAEHMAMLLSKHNRP